MNCDCFSKLQLMK